MYFRGTAAIRARLATETAAINGNKHGCRRLFRVSGMADIRTAPAASPEVTHTKCYYSCQIFREIGSNTDGPSLVIWNGGVPTGIARINGRCMRDMLTTTGGCLERKFQDLSLI